MSEENRNYRIQNLLNQMAAQMTAVNTDLADKDTALVDKQNQIDTLNSQVAALEIAVQEMLERLDRLDR